MPLPAHTGTLFSAAVQLPKGAWETPPHRMSPSAQSFRQGHYVIRLLFPGGGEGGKAK